MIESKVVSARQRNVPRMLNGFSEKTDICRTENTLQFSARHLGDSEKIDLVQTRQNQVETGNFCSINKSSLHLISMSHDRIKLLLRFPLHKLHHNIRPHQQHRTIVGIRVIKALTTAVYPVAILYDDMVARITVDFEGVGGF